jgi:hypothetical protein
MAASEKRLQVAAYQLDAARIAAEKSLQAAIYQPDVD